MRIRVTGGALPAGEYTVSRDGRWLRERDWRGRRYNIAGCQTERLDEERGKGFARAAGLTAAGGLFLGPLGLAAGAYGMAKKAGKRARKSSSSSKKNWYSARPKRKVSSLT